MKHNKKGRSGWHQATSKPLNFAPYFTRICTRIKAIITSLALWGWIPLCVAERVNKLGGNQDD